MTVLQFLKIHLELMRGHKEDYNYNYNYQGEIKDGTA